MKQILTASLFFLILHLSAQQTLLQPNDLINGNFGYSVVTNDSTLVVGTRREAAYVFKKENNEWIQASRLVASDSSQVQCFACVVDLFADYILVGGPGNDEHGMLAGAAYVFKKEGDNWVEQAKITPQEAGPNQSFGSFVSIYENRILVAATTESIDGLNYSGAAYIFKREGEQWIQEAKLIPSDPTANAAFGNSVSIYGDYAFVGAVRAPNENAIQTGAVYVFKRIGDDWVEQQKIVPNDGLPNDGFGKVIAQQDTLFVGAIRGGGANEFYKGAAYIYAKEGEQWVEHQKIRPFDEDDVNKTLRGYGMSSKYLAIASANNTASAPVHLYKKIGDNWEPLELITGLGQYNERYGHQLHLTDKHLVVGAIHTDLYQDNDTIKTGAIYVYDLDMLVTSDEVEQLEPSIKISPNPVEGMLRLDVSAKPIKMINVYDLNGKRVLYIASDQLTDASTDHLIDLKALHQGLYVIQVVFEHQMVTRLFVKA